VTARILWTGGWDSTFRVLDLLLRWKARVATYYVISANRRSTAMELQALSAIRRAFVAAHPGLAANLVPTHFSMIEDIRPDAELSECYRRLTARGHLGIQYEWLTRYAAQEGLCDLELSVEACDRRDSSPWHHLYAQTVWEQDAFGGNRRLRGDCSDPDLEIFRPFRFPLLDTSKLDMQETAREYGFDDLLELSWFCHQPTGRGKPCGRCSPCQRALDFGMGRRIPRSSRARARLLRLVGMA
jgi:hypothetical protein